MIERETKRHWPHLYFDSEDIPGVIPYKTIERMYDDEIYFRRYNIVSLDSDFRSGHLFAVPYYFDQYSNALYDLASVGKSYKEFFIPYPVVILETFQYLFKELAATLDVIKDNALKLNHLEETKFKRIIK